MNRTNRYLIIVIAIIAGTSMSLQAQMKLSLLEKESEIVISGTSSMHDWDMTIENMKAKVNISSDKHTIISFDKIDISLNSKDIKSHSSIMDKKTYAALKADKYPSISFKMIAINDLKTSGNSFSANIRGTLIIAGKSREVLLKSTGLFRPDNSFSTSGSVDLKMTDYGISPPTAMMGAMKTGDDINIKFNLTFRSDLNTLTNK